MGYFSCNGNLDTCTWGEYLLFMFPDDEKKLRETHPTPDPVNQEAMPRMT